MLRSAAPAVATHSDMLCVRVAIGFGGGELGGYGWLVMFRTMRALWLT
jgi:hypothetical protein